ncbi:MAG: hypothetical protein ABFC54_07710 [Thermoguttaceae bacterium]
MIRITCPNCGSLLNAKDELIGQTRKCPKCAQPVQIIVDGGIEVSKEPGLPVVDLPSRLHREHLYLICDRTHVIAMWENNGNGWMIRTAGGFSSARRNRDALPAEGDFKLVELKLNMTGEGKRLTGLASYQLVTRWALNALCQGDDIVLEKLTGLGSLNRDQKSSVRQLIREQFMRPVWEIAAEVLEYLSNADIHAHSVGT